MGSTRFLYTDSLPSQMTVPVAKELSAAIASNPKLSHLAKLCEAFINSNNLKLRTLTQHKNFFSL